MSILFRRRPSFENALVQSLAGGNTMVFNCAAKRLLEKAGSLDIVAHDWWTYKLTTAAGGFVVYDPEPSVEYRQHGQNLIGSNSSIFAKIQRIRMLLSNRFRDWNDNQHRCTGLLQGAH